MDDFDTECLHELRIAIRRIRRALRQCLGVFPSRLVQQCRQEFSRPGSVTGPLRDLDVHLLEFDNYRGSVAPKRRSNLDTLHTYLVTCRADGVQHASQNVGSRRVARLMCSWSAFLAAPVPKRTTLRLPTGPIRESADARLWKAYKTL